MDPTSERSQGGSGLEKVGKLLGRTKRLLKQGASRDSLRSADSAESRPRGRSPQSLQSLQSLQSPQRPQSHGPNTDDRGHDLSPDSRSLSMMSQSTNEAEEKEEWQAQEQPASLAAYDDPAHTSTLRPSIPSTHPSQIGQLTTSSPIIQAEHLAGVRALDDTSKSVQDDAQQAVAEYTQTATSSVSVPPNRNGAPARPSTSDNSALRPLSQSGGRRRSKSPADRIREVFWSKTDANALAAERRTTLTARFDKAELEVGAEAADRGPVGASRPNATHRAIDVGNIEIVATGLSDQHQRQTLHDLAHRDSRPVAETPTHVIINTPPTPTDLGHQTGTSFPSSQAITSTATTSIAAKPLSDWDTAGSPSSHRSLPGRPRSATTASVGPSKLSNVTKAPMTPTPEEAAQINPSNTGFFSSVLSAAQTATNTLSSTVTTTNIGLGWNKAKSSTNNSGSEQREGDGGTTEVESSEAPTVVDSMAEPAIRTLGRGDLSLSHLGVEGSGSAVPTPTGPTFSDGSRESRGRPETARAGTVTPGYDDDASPERRPRSWYEPLGAGGSPPGSATDETTGLTSGLRRGTSIRSAISRSRRRKRGGTGGTGGSGSNSVGAAVAAVAAAQATLAHPQASASTPKLTGFAVASKKRNRDFHTLFKSVPDDDYLIEDYSCALQREILAHGRLYVSEGHLCFSSNIFGWVTTLVMSFDEIVAVEKRSTALLFKNGLMISTLHAKHVFASFTSRDSTYDLIVNIWKLGHPTLRSTLNGVSLDETGGDRTEKYNDAEQQPDHSGSGSDPGEEGEDSEDDDKVYDEDEDEAERADASPADFVAAETEGDKGTRVSGQTGANAGSEKSKDGAATPTGVGDFPGPATHPPTDCGDGAAHYERNVGDDVIPAPLGKVYNTIFGPASVSWMSKWLTTEQKCMDLQMEDKTGLTQDNRARHLTYIKPLSASLGPKQTKCIVTETLEHIDLEKWVNVSVSVQNPDVPSGNVFSVKTKYCLTWAENNHTRIQAFCAIEWSGKSWLKGPIEKGVNDGQIQYFSELFASLKTAVSSSAQRAVSAANGAPKFRKKKEKNRLTETHKESRADTSRLVAAKVSDWGMLEPLHGVLGPVVDIIKPMLTGNVVYGLLVGLLVASWFGFGSRPAGAGYGHGMSFATHPDRLLAYEEIWRREESELWGWLEERVGLQRLNENTIPPRKHVMEARTVEEKLREEGMSARDIEEAIRVTEEKLEVLKSVHYRNKAGQGQSERV